MRTLLPTAALLLLSALACASGGRDTGPLEGSLDENGDCSSTVSGEREPVEPVTPQPYSLSGSAWVDASGALQITLNPIVNTQTNAPLDRPDAADLSLWQGSGEAIAITAVTAASDAAEAPVDVVFVLDTTGSMAWAIDGVKQGVRAFADTMTLSGLDVAIGGIEFGDQVRTSIHPTDPDDFKQWASGLSASGGGDTPENPLDAIASAYTTFPFRQGAMRYFVVITDVGMHEGSDGLTCAAHTTADIVALTRGSVLYGVLKATLGLGEAGVPVQTITEGAGGLYVEINMADAITSFNISTDTPLDELLDNTTRITADGAPLQAGDALELRWERGTETQRLPLIVQ